MRLLQTKYQTRMVDALQLTAITAGYDALQRRLPDPKGFLFKLPSGEPIRAGLLGFFRKQLKFLLGTINTIGAGHLPDTFPDLYHYDSPMRWHMTPILSAYWDQAGKTTMERLGVDPDAWKVTNPHTQQMIGQAAFDFCHETNATTSQQLNDALGQLRKELIEGIVEKGETLRELTKRVEKVFDAAETWRALRIAKTESARAVHAAQEQAAIDSGVVAGFKWLLSSEACPLCYHIADEVNQVPIGQAFAEVGKNPTYRAVRYPPAHPHCGCAMTEILTAEYGGPQNPKWGSTSVDPQLDHTDDEE